MKDEKIIKEELEKYKGIETHDYGHIRPLNEWIMQQDIGYRKALIWVLDSDKEKEE